MSWAGLTLVTDAELGQLEPEAINAGSASAPPWGAVTWPSARSLAKRDLKVLLEIAFPTIPGVADRVLDVWRPDWAFAYTGGIYTDVTTKVKDDVEADLDLSAVFVTPSTDRLYIGAAWEYDGLFVRLLANLNAIASVLTVKYWGPGGWTSLTNTDGTITAATKTLSGSGRVTWTIPTDWGRRKLNGTADEYYWIELSVNFALTAGTSATQVLPIKAPDGLKTVAAYFALAYIFKGLSAQAAAPQYWLDRAADYDNRGRTLFATLKESGGIPLDIDSTGAIDPVLERPEPLPVRLYRG